jgi:hypothetical protein
VIFICIAFFTTNIFFVMNIQCFWVKYFVDFLFVLFEEVMGFIILKILVFHFFFFFCSVPFLTENEFVIYVFGLA